MISVLGLVSTIMDSDCHTFGVFQIRRHTLLLCEGVCRLALWTRLLKWYDALSIVAAMVCSRPMVLHLGWTALASKRSLPNWALALRLLVCSLKTSLQLSAHPNHVVYLLAAKTVLASHCHGVQATGATEETLTDSMHSAAQSDTIAAQDETQFALI